MKSPCYRVGAVQLKTCERLGEIGGAQRSTQQLLHALWSQRAMQRALMGAKPKPESSSILSISEITMFSRWRAVQLETSERLAEIGPRCLPTTQRRPPALCMGTVRGGHVGFNTRRRSMQHAAAIARNASRKSLDDIGSGVKTNKIQRHSVTPPRRFDAGVGLQARPNEIQQSSVSLLS